MDELMDNVKAVLEAVSAHKSASAGSPLIRRVSVACPPTSPEVFLIRDPLLPLSTAARAKQPAEIIVAEEEEEEEQEEGVQGASENKKFEARLKA